jgi:hypothetical protein
LFKKPSPELRAALAPAGRKQYKKAANRILRHFARKMRKPEFYTANLRGILAVHLLLTSLAYKSEPELVQVLDVLNL